MPPTDTAPSELSALQAVLSAPLPKSNPQVPRVQRRAGARDAKKHLALSYDDEASERAEQLEDQQQQGLQAQKAPVSAPASAQTVGGLGDGGGNAFLHTGLGRCRAEENQATAHEHLDRLLFGRHKVHWLDDEECTGLQRFCPAGVQ